MVEGLALEIPPQCLASLLDQVGVSYKVISLTFCGGRLTSDNREEERPCLPASLCKVMNTDSLGTVHLRYLPLPASKVKPLGIGKRHLSDRARTASLLHDSLGLPS